MSDYTPVYVPGRVITLTASAAITGGQPLVVSGSGTVAPASTLASTAIVGVAADDTPLNGRVTVYARGTVHESVADGTVTAGDQVTSTNTANRQVKTLALVTTSVDVGAAFSQSAINNAINAVATSLDSARGVLGVALTTGADNTKVRWMEF